MNYLEGKLLIATNKITEPDFKKSVIYICGHNKDGAIGVVINRLLQQVKFSDIIDDIELLDIHKQIPVYLGGPVESHKGLVLHSDDFLTQTSRVFAQGIAITSDMKILKSMAQGASPKKNMLVVGYAGWGFEQLNNEIRDGSWLVTQATQQLLFDIANEDKWHKATESIGIDPSKLSTSSGRC
jgi:putative transcriptional regulator